MATGYPEEVGIIDIARWLTKRKGSQRRKVLVLGSRAGALFRSPSFYTVCEWFNPLPFTHLVRTEQFTQCYRALQLSGFSQERVQNFLKSSIAAVPIGDGDRALAELVKSGLFDMIVTTNIDTIVEQAFHAAGMVSPRDFQVFNLTQKLVAEVRSTITEPSCTLINVFGDVADGMCAIDGRVTFIAQHHDRAKLLTSCFEEDILLLGYDPYWDEAIGRQFPPHGGEFWYINEGSLDTIVARKIVSQRQVRCLIGDASEYSSFLCSLYWYIQRAYSTIHDEHIEHIYEQLSGFDSVDVTGADTTVFAVHSANEQNSFVKPEPDKQQDSSLVQSKELTASLPLESVPEPPAGVSIFYSKEDKRQLTQFIKFMQEFESAKKITLWMESKIYAGDNVLNAYESAIEKTQIAVVFISTTFMETEFLSKDVFDLLRKAKEQRNLRIIPVYVDPCIADRLEIDDIKAFNDAENPLSSLKREDERKKIFVQLAMLIVFLAITDDRPTEEM